MPYTKKAYTKPSICWKCKNAVPDEKHGCSWSREFKPVEGWDAEPSVIRNASHRKDVGPVDVDTYLVKACPKFVKDDQPQREETWDGVQEVMPPEYLRLLRIRAGARRVAKRHKSFP